MKIFYNPKLKKLARYLRNNSTLSEVLLWNELKQKQLGFQFYRQKPLGNYIVDFYCPRLKLVIEVDGESHQFSNHKLRDNKKDVYLQGHKIHVMRFDDQDVKANIDAAVEGIKEWIESKSRVEE